METFLALLALCERNPPVESPHKSQSQCRGALSFFICGWTNGWAKNRYGGDLRRHRAHYEVILMWWPHQTTTKHYKTRTSVHKSWDIPYNRVHSLGSFSPREINIPAFPNLFNPSQIAKFMGPTWGPHGSYRPQMGPMLAPSTLLSGILLVSHHDGDHLGY